MIWTVSYVIIHGSLFKLEFKTTNFRILVCRKDKKGWTRFDLRPDYEIVDQRLLSACQLIAKLWVQRLVSGFFLRATRCHTLCRRRFPPACQRLTSPVGLTGRCLRPTCCCRHRASFIRLRQDYVTRVRSFGQKRAQCSCSPRLYLALRDFSSSWLTVNEDWDRPALIYVRDSHPAKCNVRELNCWINWAVWQFPPFFILVAIINNVFNLFC